jgi:hypothetical protein
VHEGRLLHCMMAALYDSWGHKTLLLVLLVMLLPFNYKQTHSLSTQPHVALSLHLCNRTIMCCQPCYRTLQLPYISPKRLQPTHCCGIYSRCPRSLCARDVDVYATL